ncbi:hypothetical protein ABMY09_23220, partial [Vibrio vulnificus]
MAFLVCGDFGVEVLCSGLVLRASPLNWALCVKESMTKFINLFLCLLSLNCLAAEPIKEWNELN